MDARNAALRVLTDLREGRHTARQAIDELLEAGRLDTRELPLASELAHGVIRHRLTLAAVLNRFTHNRWQRIARRVQHILMLGAYQIIWLDSVPVFAAVNEAVNQGKNEGGRRTGQFVNAILRQLERDIVGRRVPAAQAQPTHAVPIDRTTCCELARAVLPDPQVKRIEYLSQATSHPGWLVSRWMDAYGPERTERICRAGMLRPPVIVRFSPRADRHALLEQLTVERLEPQPAANCGMIVLSNTEHLTRSPALAEGLVQPQDPTATLPVEAMRLQPGQVVLDLCAGLGTKTTQAAAIVGETGRVLATDADATKLSPLTDAARRQGLENVDAVRIDEIAERTALADRLDWILIDAPCSNTGVLARRPEIRYRLTPRALGKLADTQLSLVQQAVALAHAHTRILYSTCSIDPEENEQVVSRFLQARPDWQLADNVLTLPDAGTTPTEWHDGGYWAALRRR